MGQLVYFINHTLKEYFCPYASKWGELLSNKEDMEAVLEFIRDYWNNNTIEIMMEIAFDNLDKKEYKESEAWELNYEKMR